MKEKTKSKTKQTVFSITKDGKMHTNEEQFVYMPRSLIVATLPHSRLEDPTFQRRNGRYVLTIIAHPTFGLPFGATARLILIWIMTEAIKKQSREMTLGKSFSTFLKKLDLRNSGGKRGNMKRVREQMMALLTCQISSIFEDKKTGKCVGEQFQIGRSFQLWWQPSNESKKYFSSKSTLVLSQDFFDELKRSVVPLDLEMIKLLRRSPLQMDIYMWLTYRFFSLKEEAFVPWHLLQEQFGSDYRGGAQGCRNFKKKFLQALKKITALYPKAQIETMQNGLVLYASDTHVQKKRRPSVDNLSYPR